MLLQEERRSGHGSSALPSGREVESNERGDTRQAELLAEAGFPSSERLSETSKTPVAMEHAKSLGWVDGDQTWKILRWNPTQQHLEVEPVPTTDLVTQIVPVRKAITEETLLRPKSIRRRPQNASSFRWPSLPRRSADLGYPPDVDWTIGMAHVGLQAPARPSTVRQPALEPRLSVVPSLKAVLNLSLCNTSNLCYLNSTVLSVTWTILQVKLHGPALTMHMASESGIGARFTHPSPSSSSSSDW